MEISGAITLFCWHSTLVSTVATNDCEQAIEQTFNKAIWLFRIYPAGRFFLKEFLIAIFPFRKVKTSHPTTSSRLPSDWVPENIH